MSDLNEERLAEIQRVKEETARALKGKEFKNSKWSSERPAD